MDANGNPSGELPLSGGWDITAAEGFGFAGDMVTENLTPGGKLAGYSDGELFRVLRYGLNQDGDLLAFMPLLPYAQLSDADTEAIIAYLRSQPPVEQPVTTGDKLTFVGAVFMALAFLAHQTQELPVLPRRRRVLRPNTANTSPSFMHYALR